MRPLLLLAFASLAAVSLSPHAQALPGCGHGTPLDDLPTYQGASRDPTPVVDFIAALPGQIVWVCFDGLVRSVEDMPCG